jgi:hypothetical protein
MPKPGGIQKTNQSINPPCFSEALVSGEFNIIRDYRFINPTPI